MVKTRASAVSQPVVPTPATTARAWCWIERSKWSRIPAMGLAAQRRAPRLLALQASRHARRTPTRMHGKWNAASPFAARTPAAAAGSLMRAGRSGWAIQIRSAAEGPARNTLALLAGRQIQQLQTKLVLTTKLAAPRPVRSFRSSVLETMRQTARRITRSAIPLRRAAPRPVLCTPVARASSFPRARVLLEAPTSSAAKTAVARQCAR
mmetsp:Transcript_96107/g.228896  ORF Transcript_96107/g.228896 Transcript_96107/m.228896 type:complete len:208 (+) Transcript_96107:450-1073(+)